MLLTPSFTALATILGAGLVADARPWNYGNSAHVDSPVARAITVPGSILHLHTSSLPDSQSASTAINTPAVSLPTPTTMTTLASATLANPSSTVRSRDIARGQDDVYDVYAVAPSDPLPGSANPASAADPSAPVSIPTTASAPSASITFALPEISSVDISAANPATGTPTVTITTSALPTADSAAALPTDVTLDLTTTSTSHAPHRTRDPSKPSRGMYGHTMRPNPEKGADESDWDSDDDDTDAAAGDDGQE
ncbi:hypothetical protein C8Q80DRAFT_1122736 [Daedaleopsis nitida]|nr:hypothetical protein C8Q80DRAFT_1122736 [Daedaleopsis nitida]